LHLASCILHRASLTLSTSPPSLPVTPPTYTSYIHTTHPSLQPGPHHTPQPFHHYCRSTTSTVPLLRPLPIPTSPVAGPPSAKVLAVWLNCAARHCLSLPTPRPQLLELAPESDRRDLATPQAVAVLILVPAVCRERERNIVPGLRHQNSPRLHTYISQSKLHIFFWVYFGRPFQSSLEFHRTGLFLREPTS
jgi:hypothetical protein